MYSTDAGCSLSVTESALWILFFIYSCINNALHTCSLSPCSQRHGRRRSGLFKGRRSSANSLITQHSVPASWLCRYCHPAHRGDRRHICTVASGKASSWRRMQAASSYRPSFRRTCVEHARALFPWAASVSETPLPVAVFGFHNLRCWRDCCVHSTSGSKCFVLANQTRCTQWGFRGAKLNSDKRVYCGLLKHLQQWFSSFPHKVELMIGLLSVSCDSRTRREVPVKTPATRAQWQWAACVFPPDKWDLCGCFSSVF